MAVFTERAENQLAVMEMLPQPMAVSRSGRRMSSQKNGYPHHR